MKINKILTLALQFLVGGLFIFSGFIKANDPSGFAFKLQEYFEVFDIRFLDGANFFKLLAPMTVGLSILICISEIVIGVLLILGKWKRITLWLLLIMILFFTFLTYYSWSRDVVTDCGCFGDAIKLTPKESFFKDLILLILIGLLWVMREHIVRRLSIVLTNNILAISLLLSTLFPLYNWYYLPVLDFRPYKVGNDIVEQMKVPEGELASSIVELKFIYRKDGVEKEYDMSNLPSEEDGYEYVDRIDKVIKEAYHPPVHDFTFSTFDGRDVTDSFLGNSGYKLMCIQYNLDKTDKSKLEAINTLEEKLKAEKVSVFNVTSSGEEKVAELKTPMKYISADGTMLKTVIRSNPGLVLFKNNVVIAKWPSTALPDFAEIKELIKQ